MMPPMNKPCAEIPDQLMQLENLICEIESQVKRVEERTSPIRRMSPGSPVNPNPAVPEAVLVPVASQIRNFNRRLNAACAQLNEIHNTIEL